MARRKPCWHLGQNQSSSGTYLAKGRMARMMMMSTMKGRGRPELGSEAPGVPSVVAVVAEEEDLGVLGLAALAAV